MKKGQKNAVRGGSYDNEKAAISDAHARPEPPTKTTVQHYVEKRIGTPNKCLGGYCNAWEFCSQFKAYQGPKEKNGLQHTESSS